MEEELKVEESPKVEEHKDTQSIDINAIVDAVMSKMSKESKVEEKEVAVATSQPKNEYMDKYAETELKYNKLNTEYVDLQKQLADANKKLAEANAKLEDYSTFGKTPDEIKDNSRIVNDYKRQQGGLTKL